MVDNPVKEIKKEKNCQGYAHVISEEGPHPIPGKRPLCIICISYEILNLKNCATPEWRIERLAGYTVLLRFSASDPAVAVTVRCFLSEAEFPRDKWCGPPFHIPVSGGPPSCRNHGTRFVYRGGIALIAGSVLHSAAAEDTV